MKKAIITTFIILFYFLPLNSKAEFKPIFEGNADTKIKLIVFESLTCSHCANFHKKIYPNLKKDFLDKGLISIEFRNFPLDMAALSASMIAHCRNDGKSEILHHLYLNQEEWVKSNDPVIIKKHLDKYIKENMKYFNLKYEKCTNDKLLEDHILEDRIEGAKKFKIEATPTLIINGEKFENPSNYKKLKKYLEKLI